MNLLCLVLISEFKLVVLVSCWIDMFRRDLALVKRHSFLLLLCFPDLEAALDSQCSLHLFVKYFLVHSCGRL